MKNILLRICLIITFFLFFSEAYSQSTDIKLRNFAELDSAEDYATRTFCDGLSIVEEQTREKYLKKDKIVYGFVNKLVTPDMRYAGLIEFLKKKRKLHVIKSEYNLGVIKKVELSVGGVYFGAKVTFNFIDSISIAKSCIFRLTTRSMCNNYSILGFGYIRNVLLENIEFPLRIRDIDMQYKEVQLNNIKLLNKLNEKYFFYTGNESDEDWVRNFILKQYEIPHMFFYYSRSIVEKEFLLLVKQCKTEVLKKLLYSPNYYFAVNSMEALIYLQSINQIIFKKEIMDRINEVKNEPYQLIIQHSNDFYRHVNGYSILKMLDSDIIRKYKNNLKEQ